MAKRPLTAIPATRSPAKVLKAKQTAVFALLIGCMLAGPLSLVLAAARSGGGTVVADSHPTTVASFAEIVARDYLAGRPTTMPVAKDVDPLFGFGVPSADDVAAGFDYDTLALYSIDASFVEEKPIYTSVFRVRADGDLYDLTIVTGQDARSMVVLAAQPMLSKASVAASGQADPPRYQGNLNLADDQAVETLEAIERWAGPYAADNREQLRLVVGGGPQDGAYVGLGDFELRGRPDVLAVVAQEDGSAIVRARVVFAQVGANGFQSSNEFDLLVQDHLSADARVVAWGPAGSGPTLSPYQNNTANQ